MRNLSQKLAGQLLTVATLAIGVSIGYVIGYGSRPLEPVQAQAVIPPATSIQEVSPVMTVGSLGTNLIMAHEIAADSLVVNGFDMLKMQQNIINYLANRPNAEKADLLNVINASRATTAYRIKPPVPTPSSPEKKP